MTKVFFVERFSPYSVKLFEKINEMSDSKKINVVFVGPDEKFKQKFSYKIVEESKKIWSYKHFVRKINKFVKKENPDVVHIIFEPRTFGSMKSAIKIPILLKLLQSKTKTIITIRNIFVYRKNGLWELPDNIPIKIPKFILKILIKIFIKKICKYSHKIIVDTNESKLALIEFFEVSEKKINVISVLGLDTKPILLISEKKEKFVNMFGSKKIILIFGVISSRKGQLEAIEAFSKISKDLPDYILVIAGSPTEGFFWYDKQIQKNVRKQNLEDKVKFTGFLEEVEIDILFNMAEMILFNYQQTSSSASALRFAFEHNKPCIVSNIPTFTEILGNKSALFIDPHNIKQLSSAIVKLATNENLKLDLKNEMKTLEDKFSWITIVEKHLKIYGELVENS
jgi:glycosyltransferase involved in cell wall biosynthesis